MDTDFGNDPRSSRDESPTLDTRIFGSRKHTEPARLLINRVRRRQKNMLPVQTTLVTNTERSEGMAVFSGTGTPATGAVVATMASYRTIKDGKLLFTQRRLTTGRLKSLGIQSTRDTRPVTCRNQSRPGGSRQQTAATVKRSTLNPERTNPRGREGCYSPDSSAKEGPSRVTFGGVAKITTPTMLDPLR